LARQPKSTAGDPDVLKKASRRADLGGQVRSQFNAIEKVQEERINAWEANAGLPKRDVGGADVLAVIIAIVSEGMGGVAYGLIAEMMTKKTAKKTGVNLVHEFVGLAGLEAGDLAAEKVFHDTMSSIQKYTEKASSGDSKGIQYQAGRGGRDRAKRRDLRRLRRGDAAADASGGARAEQSVRQDRCGHDR
jgi:hypothetical protein